jgi:hypothetical protein
MTTTIILAIIVGWIALSCLVCVALCMASSRFTGQIEGRDAHLQARPRRVEAGARPRKVNAG